MITTVTDDKNYTHWKVFLGVVQQVVVYRQSVVEPLGEGADGLDKGQSTSEDHQYTLCT